MPIFQPHTPQVPQFDLSSLGMLLSMLMSLMPQQQPQIPAPPPPPPIPFIPEPIYPPIPAFPPVDLAAQQLKEKMMLTLEKAQLKRGDLETLRNAKPGEQYRGTVNAAYGFNIQNGYITQGVFAGKRLGQVKTADLIRSGVFPANWNWNLNALEGEFAPQFGKMPAGRVMHNINDTVSRNRPWHSTPLHLAKSQEYLNLYKEAEALLNRNPHSFDPQLVAQAQELRTMAALHYQIAQTSTSPVVMDLEGNGKIDLTSVAQGVQFDIDGDGKQEQVAWTQAKGEQTDGWLTLDRNSNGKIDNGKELFGNQHGQANGYQELRKFDTNRDGRIDSKDAVYKKLKVWKDKNHDGISQANEMVSLVQGNVKSINLDYKESTQQDAFGNGLRQQSQFSRISGKDGLTADAWLAQIA
jgi:hypothetical protein